MWQSNSSNLKACVVTEEYNAALEKMNAQMSAENTALANDNKQLGTLVKEYEQTLENVMTAFRVRAVRHLFAASRIAF